MPEIYKSVNKETDTKTKDNYSYYTKYPNAGMNETCFKSEKEE